MVKSRTLLVCQGTGCISGGSGLLPPALESEITRHNLQDHLQIKHTGCHGFCQRGPLVVIEPEGTFYTKVTPADVPEIIAALKNDLPPVPRLLYYDNLLERPISNFRNIPFYYKQRRVVLRNCGFINPENIDDYLGVGGYHGLQQALQMQPAEVIEEVKKSGLRGLGGAGFPAGRKWEAAAKAPGKEKYVICNGDEGDPGAFQDRSVLEGDPHAVLEGMLIAAYAIGAQKGYAYVRHEYPLAVRRLQIAIDQARTRGFLGHNILGSRFSFDVEIFQGAGAFVCGESTALVLSIEGKRGFPRAMPRPRTTEAGLWGKPTLLNNVKTFANIPLILKNGWRWLAYRGTETSKGTAVFSLTGKVVNSGLIEVEMGTRLREIIYDIGGGIPGGRAFKAVQTGGPSGGVIPVDHLDTPVDYETLGKLGSIMGSGGMIV
ncbi:MAG: NAD(P)H-dependent oxidoreductase subunit E, partial [Dehalococcoidales bacterium]|nr:NAD(P)H-dependent oxidoreductase subunit E [Dehalococcoidales bacterium]